MHNQLDNTQHQDPELTRNISFQILSPNPLLPQHTHMMHVPVGQVYHLTEEIKCRNDSFIAPSKALVIVNRGDWLGSPANIKRTNKDAKIYVGRSTTLHNLLFCAHTLYMGYVTNTFLLVSSSVRSKQLLCFVQGQDQKTEQ